MKIKYITRILIPGLLLTGMFTAAFMKPQKPVLYIIGDSTVRNTNRPGCGWGEVIYTQFDTSKIKISNQAMAGRSTRTFISEGRWDRVMSTIKPGDFVIMQFGHNEGSMPDTTRMGNRGVLRGTGEETKELLWRNGRKETVHSYGWYISKFCTDAISKGAIPIVASMIPRNEFRDGKVIRASNDYGKWASEAALQAGAYFVDLNSITSDKYDLMGPAEVKKLFPGDHTHTNVAGAMINAASVAEGIKTLKKCPLSKYLLKNVSQETTQKQIIDLQTTYRQMESLDRGVIAVRMPGDSVFIGWRMLGTEPDDIAFDVYRQSGTQKPVKLNKTPVTECTDYVDGSADLKADNSYFVVPVIEGKKQEKSKAWTLKAESPVQQYFTIPLKTPKGLAVNDGSVGDLDGDGEYDIVVHLSGRGIDNPSTGISGIPVFHAYKMDGTFLWEITLGRNIREGAHYTQFMVYDLDGDGKAEFVCKTADGTIDGLGKVIGDSTKDYRNLDRNSGIFYGKVLAGPEFLTVFNGQTGEAMSTVDYVPNRFPLNGWNGHGGNDGKDSSGNRVDRFLACVAYLDGVRPSVVMCRGYYGRSVLAAWDWRGGKLTLRWVFDSKDSENPFSGQGNHNLSVADVDYDGRDEIVYGSMVVDDNGRGLFSTGYRHGDALHVGDLMPDRPGIEVFGIHEIEDRTKGPGATVYDGATGEVLYKGSIDIDVGSGVAEDIDPSNPGSEMWWDRSGGLLNMQGDKIGDMPSSMQFLIWWDGDLSRELLNGNRIDKYKVGRIFTAEGAMSAAGSKNTPVLSADLFGDWREEIIYRTPDNQSLRIYTTTMPTAHRFYTLMHDPQYRLAIAWQNVAYNQPPHTSFFLGTGMKKAPKPNIVLVKHNYNQTR
jgi:rhamnogalacturonan endolyase